MWVRLPEPEACRYLLSPPGERKTGNDNRSGNDQLYGNARLPKSSEGGGKMANENEPTKPV
jgi:hypothetical protein